jgi:hypothetical protein
MPWDEEEKIIQKFDGLLTHFWLPLFFNSFFNVLVVEVTIRQEHNNERIMSNVHERKKTKKREEDESKVHRECKCVYRKKARD